MPISPHYKKPNYKAHMSLTDIFDEVSSSKEKSEWIKLETGINSIRILTEPVAFRERYFKHLNKTEICYEGCGYAGKGVSTRFLCWAIDNGDAKDEAGKPKPKLFKIGWTVMEALVGKEKMAVALGKPKFTFPMEKDLVFLKNGEKLDTTYAVEIADSNMHDFGDVSAIVAELDPVATVLENMKKATQDRHAKDGAPTVQESKEDLPVVQLDDKKSSDDIPF